MKPNLNRCPVVVAGSWNQAIFTPERVSEKLLRLGEIPGLQVSFSTSGLTTRFVVDAVVVSVTNAFLHILPRRGDAATQKLLEAIADRSLEWLPETPITGFGINFGFDVAEANEPIDSLFRGPCDEVSAIAATVDSINITRSVRVDDHTLNISLSRSAESIKLDMNHHFDARSATDARAKLRGAIARCRDMSIDIARKLYGLTSEDSWTSTQEL